MGQRLGPFLPLPTAPPILLPGALPPGTREKRAAHPLLQTARWLRPGTKAWPGLGLPACPRGLWEEDRSGMVGTGARPAQIQDGAARAGSPRSWGTALEASDSG